MATAEQTAKGEGKGRNGSRRGSTNNASRLAAFGRGDRAGHADWGNCDPRWIAAVVARITLLGGAVTFGLSRDGGAHMLTLLLDGDRQVLWFNGDASLEDELEKVYAVLDTLT